MPLDDLIQFQNSQSVHVHIGDCIEILQKLPEGHFQTCVTSPPYFGLRDYQVAGQIGMEQTPDAYVARLVDVFREVRRVLRDDGTVWLNLGDSYANDSKWGGTSGGKHATALHGNTGVGRGKRSTGAKPKDLLGMPWRAAFALQADGWWLRSAIVWNKPNPMPESVKTRPTSAYEMVFLLAKAESYYYDADAIRETATNGAAGNSHKRWGNTETIIRSEAVGKIETARGIPWAGAPTRNARNVWTITTRPFKGAHFACVDAATECLTVEGWKRYDEMRPGMLAAQFDITTQKLSWGQVEQIATYDVIDQDMIVGKCRDMDMWLTPNHRTIIQRRHKKTRTHLPPTMITADHLRASHSIPTAATWDFLGDSSLSLEWAELLGWYVAEGCESKDRLAVEIYQSDSANPIKCRRIEELLNQIRAEWTKATCDKTWQAGGVVLQDSGPSRMVAYQITGFAAVRLRELAPKKCLPWKIVLWSNDCIAAVIHGFIQGDGHTRLDGRRLLVQKNLEQCGFVQALAIRLGYSATVSIRSDGIGTVYITRHTTRSFRGTNGRGSPPVIRKYTGVVWCPKLPAATWVARRNGRVFITGNTMPPELAQRCILAGCPEGGAVLDPFGGAGTTGLVAGELNRQATLIELNPDYAEIIRSRLGHLVAP